MVDLGPDGQRAGFCLCARTGRARHTGPAIFVCKANLDHLLPRDITVGLPLPTVLALRTRRRVGLPVDRKGAIVIARSFSGLPAWIGRHGSHNGDSVVLRTLHEDFGVCIATVDEMLLGQ
jgi:hypothetical protein